MQYFNVKLSLKHRLVPTFSVLLQRIDEDIAFSSLETCTEIGSHQTIIKLPSHKGQANRPFLYHTELYTRSPSWFCSGH